MIRKLSRSSWTLRLSSKPTLPEPPPVAPYEASTPLLRRKPLLLAALLFCLAFPCPAAQSKTNSPNRQAPVPTNALPAQPQIPKSVFIIPATPQDGKDPFFPLSMRLFASVVSGPT